MESPNDVELLLRGMRLPAWGRISIDVSYMLYSQYTLSGTPMQRRHVDVGTQTDDPLPKEDPDMTLADIQPETIVAEADAHRKKRIRVD